MSFSFPEILAVFLLFGSLAGFLAGLLGVGGGIILVPLFLWGFQLAAVDPDVIVHLAFGTSLAVIIPTAVVSTLTHRRRGNVDWHQVFPLALGGMLGAVLGATLAAGLKGEWLKLLFGSMQIAVALKLFLTRKHLPPEREGSVPRLQLLAVGFAGGVFSAFFGVGGGVVAVPLMVIVLQLPIHLAVGNSSALIVVSSLFGALSYIFHGFTAAALPPFSFGYVNLAVAAVVAPFSLALARTGARLAGQVSHDKLVRVFAGILVLVGLRMIFRALA